MHSLARRCYAAMVLPTNSVSLSTEGGLRRLTRYFMQPGFREVGGLIVNPEAGEIFYLDRAEKRRSIEIVLDEANCEMLVFAGLYGSSTRRPKARSGNLGFGSSRTTSVHLFQVGTRPRPIQGGESASQIDVASACSRRRPNLVRKRSAPSVNR